MSIGFGGWAYIDAEDENIVIYQYGSYNLNEIQYKNEERNADGFFVIDKNSLVECDTHEKIKRFPKGKKKKIKKVIVEVPYSELYNNGKIQIKNCNNCFKTISDNNDYIAWALIKKVFEMYQINKSLPEKVSYNV